MATLILQFITQHLVSVEKGIKQMKSKETPL